MAAPLVGVVMGSSSDLEVMRGAISMLEKLDIPTEERIISAHRTPKAAAEYAESAVERGLEVIIAGAGKAAHLPGVLAASTPLPVVGVPMPTHDLGGMDSLLSIVQMPSGVPVACVAIGGAKNAAILACQILSAAHPEYREKVVALKAELADNVGDKYSTLK
jgi:5-(carboxyamino)imidazole ribonucleotide mutase